MPTPATRHPIDGLALGTMLLLCAVWGVQQVAIKITAPDMVPVLQTAIRNGISAVLLTAVLVVRRDLLSFRRGTWRAGLLAGTLFGAEFVLIAEGLQRTSASHMSVFLYTAPVFAALGLHLLLPAERLSAFQWLGIAVAFGGIVVAFVGGESAGAGGARMLLGDALGVLAGAAWGSTTVVIRATSLSEAPASQTLLYQLAIGFAVTLAYAVGTGQGGGARLTALSGSSLLFQGVVVSFASYLTWFWLLRRYLATRLSVFALLTPLVGVAAGVLVLHEPLRARFVAGAVLVLAGITVVSGGNLLRRRA